MGSDILLGSMIASSSERESMKALISYQILKFYVFRLNTLSSHNAAPTSMVPSRLDQTTLHPTSTGGNYV